MSAKSITYAEGKLGVHQVWEEVLALEVTIDELLDSLDKAQDKRHSLDECLVDREVELVSEQRSKHTSMSDTRFKTELKTWLHEDEKSKILRAEIAEVRSSIQGIEFDLDIAKAKHRSRCSRMEQIGGYLNYLAAVKNADTLGRKNTSEERDDK